MILTIIIALLFTFGIFLITCDLFRVPFIKTAKTVKNLTDRQKKRASIFDVWKNSLSVCISKLIRFNTYKRMDLASDLKSARLNVSPELYIAKAIVKSVLVGLLAIPAYYIFPIIFPLIIVLAVLLYIREIKSVQKILEKKRLAIEFELPRLVSTIELTLKHNRDVLTILDNYIKTAAPDMKHELSKTVADMRSGNYEEAITNLETRVNSPMLYDVTRGIISVLNGNDTDGFWINLSLKIADSQRQLLRRKAQKVPGKVDRLTRCLLYCLGLCYVVVIGSELMRSLGAMFG